MTHYKNINLFLLNVRGIKIIGRYLIQIFIDSVAKIKLSISFKINALIFKSNLRYCLRYVRSKRVNRISIVRSCLNKDNW